MVFIRKDPGPAHREEEAPAGKAVPERDPALGPLLEALGRRSIVLVGMMGAGKTSLGRRLAARLGLPFADADAEIELAADMTIPEIFQRHGEAYFRNGERRVLARLLGEGPKIIATGGGAFMCPASRERIAEQGISVWLKADFDVLMRRVRKRSNRPLLQTADPEATLRRLIAERYPVYALADITIESRDTPHENVVAEVVDALAVRLGTVGQGRAPVAEAGSQAPPGREPPEPETPGFSAGRPPAGPHPGRSLPGDADAGTSGVVTVPVGLGARAYDIVIGRGIMAEAGRRIAALAPGRACAVITDENVARHHLGALQASFDAAGVRHALIVVPPGEPSKSYGTFAHVCDAVIAARMERGDLVAALGGGVVGDLAGFVAASVRRGMRVVQLPTTLLAQVDSSVGGKTGINSPLGKNLVGAFHQPSLVLIDTAVLDTLPARELRAGYAEVAKYGLINDAAFFAWLEGSHAGIFAGAGAREQAVATSCAAKAAIVARDERETGERALLNLGHTFAHTFERLTDYDGNRLVHGEAVAIGIVCAFRLSAKLGYCPAGEADRVEAHFKAVGLPTRIGDIPGWGCSVSAVLDAMHQDKKVERGRLTFILARAVGESFVARDVDVEEVRAYLAGELPGS